MKNSHQENKQAIRNFMQKHYTDERLSELLAHAQDGKLVYRSCCCFIGIPTATHALQNHLRDARHYLAARDLEGAQEAETAFYRLATGYECDNNPKRCRILIPMIRAEMKRRAKIRVQAEWKEELVAMTT